jgi:hypothetical protein
LASGVLSMRVIGLKFYLKGLKNIEGRAASVGSRFTCGNAFRSCKDRLRFLDA